jgi:hypothetical protein
LHIVPWEPSDLNLLEDTASYQPNPAWADVLVGYVEQLGPEDRGLIEGIFWEGLTLKDAATRVGISAMVATRRRARILEDLGVLMVAEGVELPAEGTLLQRLAM